MDFRACRICLGRKNKSECVDLNNSFKEKLKECVPEMNLDVNENPTLCYDCHSELIRAHTFRSKCLSTELTLNKYLSLLSDVDGAKINLELELGKVNVMCENDCLKNNNQPNVRTDTAQHKNTEITKRFPVTDASVFEAETCQNLEVRNEATEVGKNCSSINHFEVQKSHLSLEQIITSNVNNEKNNSSPIADSKNCWSATKNTVISNRNMDLVINCVDVRDIPSSNKGAEVGKTYWKCKSGNAECNMVDGVTSEINLFANLCQAGEKTISPESEVTSVKHETAVTTNKPDCTATGVSNIISSTVESNITSFEMECEDGFIADWCDETSNDSGEDESNINSIHNDGCTDSIKNTAVKEDIPTSIDKGNVDVGGHVTSNDAKTESNYSKCKICGVEFDKQTALVKHLESHMVEKMGLLKCTVCWKTFNNFNSIKEHLQREHILCDKEKKDVTSVSEVIKKEYVGSLETIRKPEDLLRSLKIIVKEDFVCTSNELEESNNDAISSKIKKACNSLKKIKRETSDTFLCSTCGMCYKTKSQLRVHMRKHDDVLRHSCVICDERFRHFSSLKVHRRSHAKDITDAKFLDEIFRCDICDRHFYDKNYLHKHMKKHGKPEFSCESCARTFYNKGDLGKHRRIHTGEKPYKCKMCDMRFRVSASLIRHTRAHTGEKPYVCETCGKCFNQKYNLTSHMALHSDVKLYSCDSCVKSFRHKATRDMHVLRLHAKGRKLKCEMCFLCFSNEENLNGHGCLNSTQKTG